ncbi:hypothetical protein BRD56_01290 [Thermoplasmatales archaeon SW_10_69_26]|nr:MAG: hypothetical protein BRD56_01290 [Thermoplasmatales archaeon SW_10_69_26]
MRNTIILLAAASLLTMAPAAVAGHGETFEEDGEILLGQPGTNAGVGVTELGAACDTESELNGVDGQWYAIDGFDDHDFELTMDDTLDVDMYFYTTECEFIDDGFDGAEAFLGGTEDGTVPSEAAFAVVDGFAGTGDFTLSIS